MDQIIIHTKKKNGTSYVQCLSEQHGI